MIAYCGGSSPSPLTNLKNMENTYDNKTIGEVIDKSYDAGFNAAVEKTCKWLRDSIGIEQNVETSKDGEPLADSYIDYCKKRLEAANEIIEQYKKIMYS